MSDGTNTGKEPRIGWIRIKKATYADQVLAGIPHRIQQFRMNEETQRGEWVDIDVVDGDPVPR